MIDAVAIRKCISGIIERSTSWKYHDIYSPLPYPDWVRTAVIDERPGYQTMTGRTMQVRYAVLEDKLGVAVYPTDSYSATAWKVYPHGKVYELWTTGRRICSVSLTQFPSCCGASVLHNFFTDCTREERRLRAAFIEAVLKLATENIKELVHSAAFAILEKSQMKAFQPILRDLGFEVSMGFNSRKTGSNLYHFTWIREGAELDVRGYRRKPEDRADGQHHSLPTVQGGEKEESGLLSNAG